MHSFLLQACMMAKAKTSSLNDLWLTYVLIRVRNWLNHVPLETVHCFIILLLRSMIFYNTDRQKSSASFCTRASAFPGQLSSNIFTIQTARLQRQQVSAITSFHSVLPGQYRRKVAYIPRQIRWWQFKQALIKTTRISFNTTIYSRTGILFLILRIHQLGKSSFQPSQVCFSRQ